MAIFETLSNLGNTSSAMKQSTTNISFGGNNQYDPSLGGGMNHSAFKSSSTRGAGASMAMGIFGQAFGVVTQFVPLSSIFSFK
ncbi:hypothetical protein DFA_12346 [Cavenderia fasciculata]|uniref:Uncharacterized protein n=1 Tax=Cavenderia fasciculata TaxID=261658 RepID=F4QDF1_CACFS|nr:uncharacterized protein DFA_12346 [Cavenderia fasciculata]EGG14569.1 hypothetical protein DFA_12346 [Cavenderia fasciculata]|eukprot:XP_004366089.1 hypothetical protein DFA_12346 [Cavenderia fasciculata]